MVRFSFRNVTIFTWKDFESQDTKGRDLTSFPKVYLGANAVGLGLRGAKSLPLDMRE